MSSDPAPPVAVPVGLLLSRDLLFTSKVTSEARAQGARVVVAAGSTQVLAMIEQWRPRVIFLDLAATDMTEPAAVLAYRRAAGPEVPFIAFGSHVDTAALAAARDAGCDHVMPRSKFTMELAELVRRHLVGEAN